MIGRIVAKLDKWFKTVKYKKYCNNNNVNGSFQDFQPVVLRGKGQIIFKNNVRFGVHNSPYFHNTYSYLEARTPSSKIVIGENTFFNNSVSIVSESSIEIGKDVLMGYKCSIADSNFHELNPNFRQKTDANPQPVFIEDNVFLGNEVTVLKGVRIGKNTVVAARSVVTKSFPENVIIGGCPAKIIGTV